MNAHELRLLILRVLQRCGDHKLPESALKESVKQMSSEDVLTADITIDMNWLHSKRFIDYTVGELDEEKRWFITEAGKRNAK